MSEKQIELVYQGKSDYRITIEKDADIPAINAVKELQSYLNKMTGVLLPIETEKKGSECEIVIIKDTDLQEEEFEIKVSDSNLVISGGGPRGILYCVYEFLETIGCRFLAPDCEVIPETETILLESSLYIKRKPAFMLRDVYWGCAFDEHWSVKQRLNSCLLYINHGRKISNEWGGGIRNAGPVHVHNFELLVPEDEYFRDHPEYFSEINGERTAKYLYSQLCLTNEDVFDIVVEKVRKWIEEYPEARFVPISQTDSYVLHSFCTCKECSRINNEEGSYAGTLIRFVNRVADTFRDEYPDHLFETLAYQFSAAPPQVTKPRDNVIIRYCTGGCSAHPIETCELNAGSRIYIKKWGEMHNMLYVWDYTTDFAFYLCPFPNLDTLQPNMQFFFENNVKGVFEQGNYLDPISGEFGNLRCYLLAKLLFDPYTDIEKHKTEFINGYYGKGADYVRQYIDFIHRIIGERHFNVVTDPTSLYTNLISDDDIKALDELWLKAKELTKDDPVSHLHVKRSELQYTFYKVHSRRGEFSNPDTFKSLLEQYNKEFRELGVSMFMESNNDPWIA